MIITDINARHNYDIPVECGSTNCGWQGRLGEARFCQKSGLARCPKCERLVWHEQTMFRVVVVPKRGA